jgi:hypothetical protein
MTKPTVKEEARVQHMDAVWKRFGSSHSRFRPLSVWNRRAYLWDPARISVCAPTWTSFALPEDPELVVAHPANAAHSNAAMSNRFMGVLLMAVCGTGRYTNAACKGSQRE